MRIGIFGGIDGQLDIASRQWIYGVREILHQDTKHEFIILHLGNFPDDFYPNCESENISDLSYFEKLRLSKILDLDAIQLNSFPKYYYGPWLLALSTKLIIIESGDTRLSFPEHYKGREFERKVQVMTERIVSRNVDRYVAVSDTVKNTLTRKLKIDSQKVFVAPFGIKPEFRLKSNSEISRTLTKYDIEKPYVLHVSNHASVKNSDVLLKSFEYLKDQGFAHKLIIVGSRWENVTYNTKYEEDIRKLGYFSKDMQEELVDIYNGAQMLLYPSEKENFPGPIVESFKTGTPVITCKSYGIPDIAGEAALYADNIEDYEGLGMIMKKVSEDKELQTKMTQKGIERSKKYTWDKFAKNMVELYDGL